MGIGKREQQDLWNVECGNRNAEYGVGFGCVAWGRGGCGDDDLCQPFLLKAILGKLYEFSFSMDGCVIN